MPKIRLQRWLPKPEDLQKNKAIAIFAPFLADARLWHMNKGSLLRAIYIGVMCAFFPLPGQMPLAVAGALLFRANIPMSVALTWLTNPLTTLPLYWGAYWVGATLLGEPVIGIATIKKIIADTTLWLTSSGTNPFLTHRFFSLQAFALGLFISALISSVILGLLFRWAWRYQTVKDWRKRTAQRPPAINSPKKG